MQRVTKYPLLLDNIAKYTGINKILYILVQILETDYPFHWGGTMNFSLIIKNCWLCWFFVLVEDIEERKKVKRAGDCCKKILNHVNQAVKEAENKQVHTLESSI